MFSLILTTLVTFTLVADIGFLALTNNKAIVAYIIAVAAVIAVGVGIIRYIDKGI